MIKLPTWFSSKASLTSSPLLKTVNLGGVPTILEGAADDPYFQGIEGQAEALGGLAALVSRHVPKDATVVDVGANIGLSTILLARLTGHVVAFEPSPPNVAFLRRNLKRNKVNNVNINAVAASDQEGSLRFHLARFGAGSHVVGPDHIAGNTLAAVDVPAVTLDQTSLPKIAFIKLDAEGHEPNVLAGARALLMRDQPLVYTEVNVWCLTAFGGHSPGAFVRTLWNHFDVSKAGPEGSMEPLPDGYGFLHDTIVHDRGIADVVLRPRPGLDMPSLQQLAWPEAALKK